MGNVYHTVKHLSRNFRGIKTSLRTGIYSTVFLTNDFPAQIPFDKQSARGALLTPHFNFGRIYIMREKVFDLLERTALLHFQHAITIEVYGSAGTQLYRGNIMNVPFHICWSNVRSWDIENYHMIINLI